MNGILSPNQSTVCVISIITRGLTTSACRKSSTRRIAIAVCRRFAGQLFQCRFCLTLSKVLLANTALIVRCHASFQSFAGMNGILSPNQSTVIVPCFNHNSLSISQLGAILVKIISATGLANPVFDITIRRAGRVKCFHILFICMIAHLIVALIAIVISIAIVTFIQCVLTGTVITGVISIAGCICMGTNALCAAIVTDVILVVILMRSLRGSATIVTNVIFVFVFMTENRNLLRGNLFLRPVYAKGSGIGHFTFHRASSILGRFGFDRRICFLLVSTVTNTRCNIRRFAVTGIGDRTIFVLGNPVRATNIALVVAIIDRIGTLFKNCTTAVITNVVVVFCRICVCAKYLIATVVAIVVEILIFARADCYRATVIANVV